MPPLPRACGSTLLASALVLVLWGCVAESGASDPREPLRLKTETGRLLLFSAMPRGDSPLTVETRADGALVLAPLPFDRP